VPATGGAPAATGGLLATGGIPQTGGSAQTGGASQSSGGASGGGNAITGGTPSAGASGSPTGGSAGALTGGVAGFSGAGGAASGAGNGGAPNAGAGGSAGTPGGCSAPGLLFCDDFEAGTTAGMPPPSPKWSIALNGMGTVVVDGTTPAHSGSKSVHVSSAGGYQTFFALSGAPVFPPAGGLLYLRLYIRLGAAMTGGHNTYYKAGAAGMNSSEHETRIGVMNSMLMINQPAGDRGFLSNQNYYTDGMKPGVVFAPMAWTCVEALFDPPHSTFDIWVDGKEVPDLHRTDWQQDPLGSFHFGFEKYAGPDADIWYDDIAVSASPIGCR
jgi:hypothetical protein